MWLWMKLSEGRADEMKQLMKTIVEWNSAAQRSRWRLITNKWIELSGAFALFMEWVMGRRPLYRASTPLQELSSLSSSCCLLVHYEINKEKTSAPPLINEINLSERGKLGLKGWVGVGGLGSSFHNPQPATHSLVNGVKGQATNQLNQLKREKCCLPGSLWLKKRLLAEPGRASKQHSSSTLFYSFSSALLKRQTIHQSITNWKWMIDWLVSFLFLFCFVGYGRSPSCSASISFQNNSIVFPFQQARPLMLNWREWINFTFLCFINGEESDWVRLMEELIGRKTYNHSRRLHWKWKRRQSTIPSINPLNQPTKHK